MAVTAFNLPKLKTLLLHANFKALSSTELELLPTEALQCRNKRELCTFFATVTSTLT